MSGDEGGIFWSWSGTQQHSQVPENEILWRAAEASVLPPLANGAQVGAACHLPSIPLQALSWSWRLQLAAQQQSFPFHSHLALCTRRLSGGLICSPALGTFSFWSQVAGIPQHSWGQTPQAPCCWVQDCPPHLTCRPSAAREFGLPRQADTKVFTGLNRSWGKI